MKAKKELDYVALFGCEKPDSHEVWQKVIASCIRLIAIGKMSIEEGKMLGNESSQFLKKSKDKELEVKAITRSQHHATMYGIYQERISEGFFKSQEEEKGLKKLSDLHLQACELLSGKVKDNKATVFCQLDAVYNGN